MNKVECACCNPPSLLSCRQALHKHYKRRGFIANLPGRPKKEVRAPRKSRAKPRPRPLERTPRNTKNVVPSPHSIHHAIASKFKHKMDTVQRGCYRQAYLDDHFPELSETTVHSDYFEVNEVSFEEMPA